MEAQDATKHTPTKWYQWLLLYPALATSIAAAVPTVWQQYKAYRLDTTFSKVQIAEEQQQLWENNIECLTEHGIYSLDGHDGLVIGVTLCPSGDVLLRYHPNEWPPTYKWVGPPKEKKKKR
jgi:hypothetical protein